MQITRNISKHPNKKVGILNETKQLSVSFFIDLKPDDNSISRNVSSSGFNEFLLKKSIEIVSRTLHITRKISKHPDEKVGILNKTT